MNSIKKLSDFNRLKSTDDDKAYEILFHSWLSSEEISAKTGLSSSLIYKYRQNDQIFNKASKATLKKLAYLYDQVVLLLEGELTDEYE